MQTPRYPSLYQINTRVWLTELSQTFGHTATLDDIPDIELDRLARMVFDWIWLLSVLQTGQAAKQISRTNPEWRHQFHKTVTDLDMSHGAITCFEITAAEALSRASATATAT